MYVTGAQYLDQNPDVKKAGVDPLFHVLTYVINGPKEPRPLTVQDVPVTPVTPPAQPRLPADWNWQAYLAAWKDLRDAGFTTQAQAEKHYLEYGWKEPRYPLPNTPVVTPPVVPPVTPSTDTISGMAGSSSIVIHASRNYAGAIDSVILNGKQLVSSTCTGDDLQSASSFDQLGERFNPTEAGNRRDGVGPSSSVLQSISAVGNVLKTKSQMAFYLAPGEISSPCGIGNIGEPAVNTTVLSNHILTKQVTIGHASSAHVIEYLVNFYVPEAHGDAVFEVVTGYMPAEFKNFWTFNPATGVVAALSDGPGEQNLPIIFSADADHAMGVYCPDLPQAAFPKHGYGRWTVPWVAPGMVKWNMVSRSTSTPIGNYSFRCYLIVGSLENVRVSMIQLHSYLGGAAPSESLVGEITTFKRLTECDLSKYLYFCAAKIDDAVCFGTYGYQHGNPATYKPRIYQYPQSILKEFIAEAVYDIVLFKGNYYTSIERGEWPTIDKGMVYKRVNGNWTEVYRHFNPGLYDLHVHNGYLYACGIGGVARTLDGTAWESYIKNSGYVFEQMTSNGTDLWLIGEPSDYSYPAVWKNTSLVWAATDYPGVNGNQIAAFNGDLFISLAGQAKVIRWSDKVVVLNVGDKSAADIFVDPQANTLLAFISSDLSSSSGSQVWASKTGKTGSWRRIAGTSDSPLLVGRGICFDSTTGELWLPAGKWGQDGEGFGRIYKAVRG